MERPRHDQSGTARVCHPGKALKVRPLPRGAGLTVEGEVNVANRAYWACELGGLVSHDSDVELDLSRLVFIDAGGVAVLVRSAGQLREGSRMILHRPPSALTRTLEVMFPYTSAIEVTDR